MFRSGTQEQRKQRNTHKQLSKLPVYKETKIHTDFFNSEIGELSGMSLSSKILVNWSQLIAGILVDTHNIKQI